MSLVYDFTVIVAFYDTLGIRSSGGRVVKLLACGARGPGLIRFPASPLEFSEIGYLLLPSRDMAERSLNRR